MPRPDEPLRDADPALPCCGLESSFCCSRARSRSPPRRPRATARESRARPSRRGPGSRSRASPGRSSASLLVGRQHAQERLRLLWARRVRLPAFRRRSAPLHGGPVRSRAPCFALGAPPGRPRLLRRAEPRRDLRRPRQVRPRPAQRHAGAHREPRRGLVPLDVRRRPADPGRDAVEGRRRGPRRKPGPRRPPERGSPSWMFTRLRGTRRPPVQPVNCATSLYTRFELRCARIRPKSYGLRTGVDRQPRCARLSKGARWKVDALLSAL